MKDKKITFSQEAQKELKVLVGALMEIINLINLINLIINPSLINLISNLFQDMILNQIAILST
jgi:hypothetical protein